MFWIIEIEKLVIFRRNFVNSDLNEYISYFSCFANFTLTSELIKMPERRRDDRDRDRRRDDRKKDDRDRDRGERRRDDRSDRDRDRKRKSLRRFWLIKTCTCNLTSFDLFLPVWPILTIMIIFGHFDQFWAISTISTSFTNYFLNF